MIADTVRRGMSLRQRLLLLTLLTSGIGLLLGCGAYLAFDLHDSRLRTVQELQSTADMIGTNAVAALAFDDPHTGIRRLIDSRVFDTAAGPLNVSMSLGVAGTDDWNGLTAEQLIHEADIALYHAKETGRNRSVLALPSGQRGSDSLSRKETPISAD